jgi:hypothetical protein
MYHFSATGSTCELLGILVRPAIMSRLGAVDKAVV